VRWLIYALIAYLIYRLIASSRRPPSQQPRFGDRHQATFPSAVVDGVPAHEILEVEPDASAEEIRRAYQQKIRQYHPDRVAGAAAELRELAEKRSKEINAAYQALTKR